MSERCKCGAELAEDWWLFCPDCYVVERNAARAGSSGHRLSIELVPSTCWYSNLRNAVSAADWDGIRRAAYAAGGYRCGVCGVSAKLHCHEVWHYDDVKHVQRLDGFVALCKLCHMAKHIGYAGMFFDDYNGLIRHFMRVNGCSYRDFVLARSLAFDVWRERSAFDWVQDLGKYASMVAGKS